MFLEWLNSQLHIISVLWLFPIVFMFHDFEELLTIENWMTHNKEKVFAAVPKFMHKYMHSSFQMTTIQYATDIFWLFLIITTATILAVFFSFYYLFLMFLTILFAHVFTHMGHALYLRKYTPGVITAILLVLPYTSYAFYRLLNDQVVSSSELIWSATGTLLILPFLVLFMVKGRNRVVKS